MIGLIGGVASGKSLVADEFRRLGAVVLDADRAGHEVLRMPTTIAAVRRRWGETALAPDGTVDRRALAQIVFGPEAEASQSRRDLEQLTHPEIGRMLARQALAAGDEGRPAAVLDAALALEAGWDRLCHRMVYVDAPRDVRLARARERGWTDEQFLAREGAQLDLDKKRSRASAVIDNGGSVDATRRQVEKLWNEWIGDAPTQPHKPPE